MTGLPGLDNVTRVEFIDWHEGRVIVRYGTGVWADLQDGGRTLKVFGPNTGEDEARQAHLDAGWPT